MWGSPVRHFPDQRKRKVHVGDENNAFSQIQKKVEGIDSFPDAEGVCPLRFHFQFRQCFCRNFRVFFFYRLRDLHQRDLLSCGISPCGLFCLNAGIIKCFDPCSFLLLLFCQEFPHDAEDPFRGSGFSGEHGVEKIKGINGSVFHGVSPGGRRVSQWKKLFFLIRKDHFPSPNTFPAFFPKGGTTDSSRGKFSETDRERQIGSCIGFSGTAEDDPRKKRPPEEKRRDPAAS